MGKYKDELRAQKRKKLIVGAGFLLVIFFAALAGLIYFLFFTSIFKVELVETKVPIALQSNLQKAVDNWLDNGFWYFKGRNNILFISSDKLVAQLAVQFPKLESIKIIKDLPHALTISAVERKVAGIWCLSAQTGLDVECFYFDKGGVAFAEANPSSGYLIPVITDRRSGEIKLGEKIAVEGLLSNIMKARELLAATGIDANFIIPTDSFEEFNAKTANGWTIMFSNLTNIEQQISALVVFLKEKLTPAQKAELEYVDLRIQDRIYYK